MPVAPCREPLCVLEFVKRRAGIELKEAPNQKINLIGDWATVVGVIYQNYYYMMDVTGNDDKLIGKMMEPVVYLAMEQALKSGCNRLVVMWKVYEKFGNIGDWYTKISKIKTDDLKWGKEIVINKEKIFGDEKCFYGSQFELEVSEEAFQKFFSTFILGRCVVN